MPFVPIYRWYNNNPILFRFLKINFTALLNRESTHTNTLTIVFTLLHLFKQFVRLLYYVTSYLWSLLKASLHCCNTSIVWNYYCHIICFLLFWHIKWVHTFVTYHLPIKCALTELGLQKDVQFHVYEEYKTQTTWVILGLSLV